MPFKTKLFHVQKCVMQMSWQTLVKMLVDVGLLFDWKTFWCLVFKLNCQSSYNAFKLFWEKKDYTKYLKVLNTAWHIIFILNFTIFSEGKKLDWNETISVNLKEKCYFAISFTKSIKHWFI